MGKTVDIFEWKNSRGGPGSGNFGHEGRPGEQGGSGGGSGSGSSEMSVGSKIIASTDIIASGWEEPGELKHAQVVIPKGTKGKVELIGTNNTVYVSFNGFYANKYVSTDDIYLE